MAKEEIKVQIVTTRPISFSVNSEIKTEEQLSLDDMVLSLETEFRVNKEHSIIGIAITFYTLYADQELFRIESFFEFKLESLSKVVSEKNNKPFVEPDFGKKLLNICIGGTRGMLSIYLSNTQYDWFTMPIANLPDTLDDNSK